MYGAWQLQTSTSSLSSRSLKDIKSAITVARGLDLNHRTIKMSQRVITLTRRTPLTRKLAVQNLVRTRTSPLSMHQVDVNIRNPSIFASAQRPISSKIVSRRWKSTKNLKLNARTWKSFSERASSTTREGMRPRASASAFSTAKTGTTVSSMIAWIRSSHLRTCRPKSKLSKLGKLTEAEEAASSSRRTKRYLWTACPGSIKNGTQLKCRPKIRRFRPTKTICHPCREGQLNCNLHQVTTRSRCASSGGRELR